MKLRRLRHNTSGSIDPVLIFFICIGVAGILILILGEVLTPFFQFMDSTDDSIDPSISAPRGYLSDFIHLFWPKGLMLVIIIGLIFCLVMTYQKARYKELM